MYDFINWKSDVVTVNNYYDHNNIKRSFISVYRYTEDGHYAAGVKAYKNGSHRIKLHHWLLWKNPVTMLNTCARCGKTSIPRRVHIRYMPGLFNMEIKEIEKNNLYNKYESIRQSHVLCTGCWNVLRAISKKYERAEELRLFINRVKRELRDEQKARNNRAAS